MGLQPSGRFTRMQAPFPMIESISPLMASFHSVEHYDLLLPQLLQDHLLYCTKIQFFNVSFLLFVQQEVYKNLDHIFLSFLFFTLSNVQVYI